ncbi:carotenoid oxygenase family protein [Oceanicoccus sagamiensis]|uniref:Uncharacterized protein n=1 Tax=Oceanicoccus sagamiensis TaxID=716816 RepID=A0A1X9NLA8_9GAMM|nr:carotenoid oxygenase family protein [Oceanicoccus sagamiensis]ARN75617.1 hypothetical protein BST96_16795 [Oceanicoccus sagamiensis]
MSSATPLTLPNQPRVLPGCEQQGYASLDEEASYWVNPETVIGTIPTDIEGTLFRSCTGRNKIGEQQFGHWFDGDGMINAVTFKAGQVHFKNRYVRTPKYMHETAQQRILYRGVGTQIPGGFLKNIFRTPGNAANTNVILHGGKLLALWEGGKPYELDPATLQTVGEYNFDGMLSTGQPFSAHSRHDPRTGFLYNFGVFGIPKPKLHFYKINPEGEMVDKKSHYVGDYSMCHDFAITKNHAVFVLCPAFMRSPFKFLFGFNSIMQSIEFDPSEKTKVVVIDLNTLHIIREFEFDSFFGFHLGNAHEQGNTLHVDVLCVDTMDSMDGLSDVFRDRSNDEDFLEKGTVLKRFSLDLDTGKAHSAVAKNSIAGEFPLWNWQYTGVENRYTWLGTIVENGTPYGFNAYQKIDHHTGEVSLHDFGEGRFTSELNFIPKANAQTEDDGYLIGIIYNHHKGNSEVVILDAKDIQTEIAIIPLQQTIPFGFHGGFYPQTFI